MDAVRREEDYQLELHNDADLYVPFARTASFQKTCYEFPNENVKI